MFRKFFVLVVIVLLALAGAACGGQSSDECPTQVPVTGAQQPAENQSEAQAVTIATQIVVVTATPEPTPIPSDPVGIWEGLSSLNSYRMTMRTTSSGPTAQDQSQNTFLTEVGSDGDSSHIHVEQFSSSADDPAGSTSVQDQYRVGDLNCDVSDGESEVSENDPMAQEMIDAWFKMVDILPMANDPIYLGEEMLNGVMTNHFSFEIGGLGVDSGAEVVASNGEYWLAQDGQYIVKYTVVLEVRNGPVDDTNTETMHLEFYIETQDINQEIVITLPDSCQ